MRTEVDNIGNRTRFNGQQLLAGALAVNLDTANSTANAVTYANGDATTSVASGHILAIFSVGISTGSLLVLPPAR